MKLQKEDGREKWTFAQNVTNRGVLSIDMNCKGMDLYPFKQDIHGSLRVKCTYIYISIKDMLPQPNF